MAAKDKESEATIGIEDLGPQTFALTVRFGDQKFDCGTYLSRAAAAQAGRLFVERKRGEEAGRQKRPRRK